MFRAERQRVGVIDRQRALVSIQNPVALGEIALHTVGDIFPFDVGIADLDEILEPALQQGNFQRDIPRQGFGIADFVAIRHAALRAKGIAVIFGFRITPEEACVQPDICGKVQPALCCEGLGLISVVFGIAIGFVSLGNAVGAQARGRQPKISDLVRIADRGAAAKRVEGSIFTEQRARQALCRALGRDGNYAANGVAAPERRLRAFQHFDAIDTVRIQMGEIVAAAGAGRVIDRNTINQDERLVRRGAAYAHAGIAAERAILVDGDTGRSGDRVERKVDAQLVEILACDDGDAGADFGQRLVKA